MAEVPGWGFTLFYLSSAVGYIAYATLVKVSRRAEHQSAPTVTSIGIIISSRFLYLTRSQILTLVTCTPHLVYSQNGFRRKSFLSSVPFLYGLVVATFSAFFWCWIVFSRVRERDSVLPTLLYFCWLPFSNFTGRLNSVSFRVALTKHQSARLVRS